MHGASIPKFLLAVLSLMVLLGGCRPGMRSTEVGRSSNPRRVLIAGEASEFKGDVVRQVVETLSSELWYFRVVGLNALEREDAESYGAILLVTAMQAGRLNKKVLSYLDRDPENPRVIVFFTRGSEQPLPEKSRPDIRVDAVSSASSPERVESRADQLVALLQARF